MTKKPESKGPPLRPLEEIYKDEDIVRCNCGSVAFFDWGIQIVHKSTKFPGHRAEGYSSMNHVKICVGCKTPVIYWDGDLYDASEFIDKVNIDQLIQWSQERNSKVPVKIMDP